MTAETQKDWAGDAQNASKDGEFKRDTNYIDDRAIEHDEEHLTDRYDACMWLRYGVG